jgi:uncharacterized protein (DUF885 family)
MKSFLVPVLASLFFLGMAPANPASRDLARILEDLQQHVLEENPGQRLYEGLPVHRLPDLTFEAARREVDFLRALRERTARIDPAGLSAEERLTRELLLWQWDRSVESLDHYWTQFQVTPYSFPLRDLDDVFTTLTFADSRDTVRYLDLMNQYARIVGQIQANLEAQRVKGILLPKLEIDPVVKLIRALVRKSEEGPFAVEPARLEKIGRTEAEAFSKEVLRRVAESINPALEKLAAVPDSAEYRRQAPERVGIGQYPGGAATYRHLIHVHTTLELAPEEIHRRGLEQMAQLDARMAEVRKALGFQGTKREFHQKLRTDPRFFVKTPEEVAERLTAPLRRIEPKVSAYFLRTPKAPYGVERLPAALEGSMTYGYYRRPTAALPRGDYLFNGSRLEERSQLKAAALAYHELVPGHHFQIALQAENESLPPLRRDYFTTAYVEGWADYAAGLAEEMGGYADLWELYGRLAQDAMLTARLVVDTGMNALGWTRERAIEYLRENTLQTETEIGTETLRYSVDIPAQALAYKTGANAIWDLRRKAEKALGPKFDIRRFHEAVLGSGALPLEVLEKHIDGWIAGEQGRGASGP